MAKGVHSLNMNNLQMIVIIGIILGGTIIASTLFEAYYLPTTNLALQNVLDNCREKEIALQQGLDVNLIGFTFQNSTHYSNNNICKVIELGPYCSTEMIEHLGKYSNLFDDNLEYFSLEWPSLPKSFTGDEMQLCIDWHQEKLEFQEIKKIYDKTDCNEIINKIHYFWSESGKKAYEDRFNECKSDRTVYSQPFSGENNYEPNMTREEKENAGYKLYPGVGWVAPEEQNQVDPIYRINPETGEQVLDLDAMIKQYEDDFEIDYEIDYEDRYYGLNRSLLDYNNGTIKCPNSYIISKDLESCAESFEEDYSKEIIRGFEYLSSKQMTIQEQIDYCISKNATRIGANHCQYN